MASKLIGDFKSDKLDTVISKRRHSSAALSRQLHAEGDSLYTLPETRRQTSMSWTDLSLLTALQHPSLRCSSAGVVMRIQALIVGGMHDVFRDV